MILQENKISIETGANIPCHHIASTSFVMLVIGAGLSRTGTLSTKAALEQLLGPCYHGITPLVERPDHIPFWMDAMDKGVLDPARTRQELAGYKSGVDLPVAGGGTRSLWWFIQMLKYS